MSDENKLEPCHICSGKSELITSKTGWPDTWYHVKCLTCKYESEQFQNRFDALKNWNNERHHITVTIDTRTHKVVPIEPTREMMLAGIEHFYQRKIYDAMLAAAPSHGEDKG